VCADGDTMPGFDVSAEDLSKFVRLCFDYPLTGQAQEKVEPALEKLGGADGIVKKLKTHATDGIDHSEVSI
jgi:hypothetical protein